MIAEPGIKPVVERHLAKYAADNSIPKGSIGLYHPADYEWFKWPIEVPVRSG
ncbi:hypothetical protein HY640_00100 [Candidatus Woesearchaeota archaeon]|nr:hypothetical protein [Candidatus Woesearchaeota archaeon]